MRNIGFIPYMDAEKEGQSKSCAVEKRHQRRKMLIALLNESLPEAARFACADNGQYRQTILEIFNERILSFFQCHRLGPERPQRIVRIHTHDTLLFGRYFSCCTHPRARFFARNTPIDDDFRMLIGYRHPAAQLVAMIFDGKEIRMMLDLDTLFAHSVFRRIKRESSKRITLDIPYIHIDRNGVKTRLYPRWMQLDPRRPKRRREEIEHSLQQLRRGEIDKFYLLYPNTEQFRLPIRNKNEEEDQLKMIPYAFTFNQKEQTCKK